MGKITPFKFVVLHGAGKHRGSQRNFEEIYVARGGEKMSQTRKPKCSACGGEAECYCRDIGGVDRYDDEYTVVCGKCGHTEKKVESGGSPLMSNWSTKCPFCGEGQHLHSETPKEYL